MITGLDHIAIAVDNLDVAIEQWQQVAGATVLHREQVLEQGVNVVLLGIGTLRIELLAPLSADSPVGKFIAARGAGLHHIALSAESTQAELERLQAAGVRLIDNKARVGAEQTQVGFVHPRVVGGVLLELVEHPHGGE